MEINQQNKKIYKIFEGASILIMGLLFAVLFFLFVHGLDYYDDANVIYEVCSKGVRIILCLMAVGFFVLFHGFLKSILADRKERTYRWILFLSSALAVAIQMYFLFVVRSYYKWDTGFVIGGAASLAETGAVTDKAFYYLSVYPNQNTYVWITAMLVKLADLCKVSVVNRPLLWNLFNVICMDISLELMIPLQKKILPGQILLKDITCNWLLFLCNPFLYVGVSYYYTITISLPFSMGFVYLVLTGIERLQEDVRKGTEKGESKEKDALEENRRIAKSDKKWLRFILTGIFAGILAGIGYAIRATMIIFFVAFMIYALYKGLLGKQELRKQIFLFALVVSLTFGLSAKLVMSMSEEYVGIDTTDTAFPTMHWIMMSLTEPGGHNAEDEEFTASYATHAEKEAAVKERTKEKLKEMGVSGYLHLVKTKVERTFGDGSNGYTTFLTDAYDTGVVYEAFFGQHKDLVVLWHQGYYLFVLLGILLALADYVIKTVTLIKSWEYALKEVENGIFEELFLGVILFGGILFYILWEASEQYSVPFMLVMLLLMSAGFGREKKAETGKKSTWKRMLYTNRYAILSGLLMVGTLVIGIAKFGSFTTVSMDFSKTAANQIIANSAIEVENNKTLTQEFSIKNKFNHLIFQWRNSSMEDSDAQYQVELYGVKQGKDGALQLEGEPVFSEIIDATNAGYNGYFETTFEEQIPQDTSGVNYALTIKKIGGSSDHNLEFVVYDMYGYTPYPGGSLYVSDADNPLSAEDSLEASLLFSLTDDYAGPYSSTQKYIFFMVGMLLIFLFMGICCKIERAPNGEKRL